MIIDNILADTDDIKQGELNFMRYFVEERLDRLEKVKHHRERLEKRPVPLEE